MYPLIAQVDFEGISDLVTAIGVLSVIVILAAIAVVYLVRAEFEKQQANSHTSDANAEQSKIVGQLALDTSKQVGELQPKIIKLTEDLGTARTEITVLTERGKLNEELWAHRIEAFELKVKEKDAIISLRDKSLAKLTQEKIKLEAKRDQLLKDNATLISKVELLAEKIARLEARLELQIAKESKAATIPLNVEVTTDENGDEIVVESKGAPATPNEDNLTQKPNILDNEDAA